MRTSSTPLPARRVAIAASSFSSPLPVLLPLLLILLVPPAVLLRTAHSFSFAAAVPKRTNTESSSSSSASLLRAVGFAAPRGQRRRRCPSSVVCLKESAAGASSSSASRYNYENRIDWNAIVKYTVGLSGQWSLIAGFLKGIDWAQARFLPNLVGRVPFLVNFLFFYAFNIRSSFFSLLPNTKADTQGKKEKEWEWKKRIQPSWTPPGIVFAIMWPLFTFGLRAATSAMVVKSTGGKYATLPILCLMLHFCVGNLWNTVNNVERRLGVSVILLYGLWFTKAYASYQFYLVDPLAGRLLSLTLGWLTAAAALETNTWLINPDPDIGNKIEPLLPRKHPKWNTKFRWERK